MKTSIQCILFILCLSFFQAGFAQIPTDYTIYKLAFKKGGKTITAKSDLSTVVASTSSFSQANKLSQYLVLKRKADGIILIATALDNDKLLRHHSDGTVTLSAYDDSKSSEFEWNIILAGIYSSGSYCILADSGDHSKVLQINSNGSINMGNFGSTIFTETTNDSFRIKVVNKLKPGSF